jgi:hypothetical protein
VPVTSPSHVAGMGLSRRDERTEDARIRHGLGWVSLRPRQCHAHPQPAAPSPGALSVWSTTTFLWPIYLLPIKADSQVQDHGAYLLHNEPGSPWQEVADEFTADPADFQEHHYNEFVTALRAGRMRR